MTDQDSDARDTELVHRICAGDEAAFETVVRQYGTALHRFVVSSTHKVELADEIVQEVFLHIWMQRDEWQLHGSLRGYLYTAARNRMLNVVRRQKLERQWVEEADIDENVSKPSTAGYSADAEVGTAELADAIRDAIEALPPRRREIFLLSRDHHLSYAEIAKMMQISVNTVEVQMGHALKALRAALADWLE